MSWSSIITFLLPTPCLATTKARPELLPACNTVIPDGKVSHQLPETRARCFSGEEPGAGSVGELARDAETDRLRSAPDYTQPRRPMPRAQLCASARRFRLPRRPRKMAAVRGCRICAGVIAVLDALGDALALPRRSSRFRPMRSDELAQYAGRTADLYSAPDRWRSGL